MSGKYFFWAGTAILFFTTVVQGEIIKLSMLNQTVEFGYKRDIFQPGVPGSENLTGPARPLEHGITEEKQEKEEKVESEIRDSIFYEGYSRKGQTLNALITVNGEFFVVRPGDEILDKIKILAIDQKIIAVEVENKKYEIVIKGETP